MKKIILFLSFVFILLNTFSQNVAINNDGSAAASSAMLDIKSTSKGLLIPRMSKAQRTAILSPANALLVYQNAPDSTGFYFYNGSTWKWLSNPNSETAWSINGNAGTSPFTNILGTTDANDLAIGVNNIPRLHVTNEAEVGIGFNNPSYGLDVTTGNAAINNCNYNGMRVKTVAAGLNNDCEKGLFMGYTDLSTASNEGLLWNFGQANSGTKTLALGVGSTLTMMRLTSDGLAGIASGNMQPQYALDVNVGIGAVSPCNRNGLRLNTLQNVNNPCENGLFLGYDALSNLNKSSIWNFSADRFSQNSIIRFGFGTDFSEAPGIGEAMRILPPGKGVGINQINPLAMLHISNYTGGGVLSGLMVTSATLGSGVKGFYNGLNATANAAFDDGFVWNYQNAPVIFGTNNIERVRIADNGNIGINTTNPNAPLQFNNSIANRKIVLYEGNNNDHQYYGLGINGGTFRYQTDDLAADHVFFAAASNTSSNELMRIKGNGNIGIGTPSPSQKLEINGKIKITDGTQGNGKVLISDANGVGTWETNITITPAVTGVFAGGGATFGNGTPTGGTTANFYTTTYIDLPPGKWMVFGTYLLNGILASDAGVFIRTFLSDTNTGTGACSPNIVSGCLLSGILQGPVEFGLANGQTIINNNTGATKRYYMWANMAKYGTTPTDFNINGIGSNSWTENQLTAIPMN
jgi:hypothetical protein